MAQDFRCIEHQRVNRYPVAASQTIKVGQPVLLNSSGLVIIATASTDDLLGIAASPVTASTAGDEILVFDDPRALFRGLADDPAQVLQAVVGDTCDLIVDSGVFKLNLDATVKDVVRVRAIGSYYDPLLTGDFPMWDGGDQVIFEIALHQLDA